MSEKEYAIWFKPSGEEYNALVNKYHKGYGTPIFEPHITLLAGIKGIEDKIAEKVQLLSEEISPFEVTVNKISHSHYYYRCVILELALIPELERSLDLAKKMFGKKDTSTYLPHISIVYGNLTEKDRNKISAELHHLLNKTTKIESLSLLHASTAMPPDEWRTVLVCKL